MQQITTVGVDLAKSVFTVNGIDGVGRAVLHKTVPRERLMELIAGLPPCFIGMEACGGAHEWARRFEACGHRVGITVTVSDRLGRLVGVDCGPSTLAIRIHSS